MWIKLDAVDFFTHFFFYWNSINKHSFAEFFYFGIGWKINIFILVYSFFMWKNIVKILFASLYSSSWMNRVSSSWDKSLADLWCPVEKMPPVVLLGYAWIDFEVLDFCIITSKLWLRTFRWVNKKRKFLFEFHRMRCAASSFQREKILCVDFPCDFFLSFFLLYYVQMSKSMSQNGFSAFCWILCKMKKKVLNP